MALRHFHHSLIDIFSHMVCSLLFLLVGNLLSNLSEKKSDPLVEYRLASIHAKTDSMNTRLHRVEGRSGETNKIYGDISIPLALENGQGPLDGDDEEDDGAEDAENDGLAPHSW